MLKKTMFINKTVQHEMPHHLEGHKRKVRYESLTPHFP